MFFLTYLITNFLVFIRAPKSVFETSRSKNINYGDLKYSKEFSKDSKGNNIEIFIIEGSKNNKAVLYLHGNAGRAPYILKDASQYGTVFSPAYPGYSGSSGKTTSDNIQETVEVAMDFIKSKGFEEKNVTVIGHSLGGFPAIYSGVVFPDVEKVLVVNTFYNIQAIGEEAVGFYDIFGGNFLNSAKLAPAVKAKYRQFNNPNDKRIPYSHASRLFELIGSKNKKYSDISGTHGTFNVEDVFDFD